MLRIILLVWAVLAALCVILLGMWEAGKIVGKKLFGNNSPDKPRPEDDDNSHFNDQHFDMH